MPETYDVAEAKSHFSDLLNRAGYRGERFLIRKRGRPIAAIVGADDLAQLEKSPTEKGGLLAAMEALAESRMRGDFDEYVDLMEEIVRDRQNRPDREVSDLE